MFCFQCEQTAKGEGCTKIGVCGKRPEVAALQDLLIHEAMASTLDIDLTIDDLIGLVMKGGEINLKAMELLDAANTGTYGHPVPTKVPLGPKKGKAILVSGHDLKDLEEMLKQSQGKGINAYTHGEKKVPFFIRKKVRSRIEKEAMTSGNSVVSLAEVKAAQARYLSEMESEIKGYRIETCFGSSGCPNRANDTEHLVKKKGFRIQVGGKLGRHPRLATEITGIFSEDEIIETVKNCIATYKKYSRNGE